MYRCELCGCNSTPGEKRFTCTTQRRKNRPTKRFHRTDKDTVESIREVGYEIEREYTICRDCHVLAKAGVPINRIGRISLDAEQMTESEWGREKARILALIGI